MVSSWLCGYVSMRPYDKYSDMAICLCGCFVAYLYGYMAICGVLVILLYGYLGLWLYGFVAIWLNGMWLIYGNGFCADPQWWATIKLLVPSLHRGA